MSYNSEVKRDCIFYEEYQDMGARVDFCNFKGHGWDNIGAAVCSNCKKYVPLESVRAVFRKYLGSIERGRGD